MGKTDHDQHQIDKNHYCSVTFSKIMNGNRLMTYEYYKTLVQQIGTYRMKYMSHNWV